MNSGLDTNSNRWIRVLEKKEIKDSPFRRLDGSSVGIQWLQEDEGAMTEPIIIERPDGLGMKMPSNEFTVDEVTELIGADTPVEVIGTPFYSWIFMYSYGPEDVATQSASHGWTLGKWTDYFNMEPSSRGRICNVISLEVSGTKLSDMILPPRLVRELDWVENYWPSTRKGKGHTYPKVQLYCLMGVANAWTVSFLNQNFTLPFMTSASYIGLAHRFCWFISLLPYRSWFEGDSRSTEFPLCLTLFRFSISYGRRPKT